MKTKLNKLLIVVFLSMITGITYSQNNIIILQNGEKGLAPRYVQIQENSQPAINSAIGFLRKTFKISSNFTFTEVSNETDELGITHIKYQQYLNDIPVENAYYVLHARKGKVYSVNGEIFKTILKTNGIQKKSSISSDEALRFALKELTGKAFSWGHNQIKSKAKDDNLVYISKGNNLNSSELELVYKFDLYSEEPFERKKVYINASNGETVFTEVLKHSAFPGMEKHSCKEESHTKEEEMFAAGSTQTRFYGTKSITVSGSTGRYTASQTGNRNISITNLNGRSIGFGSTPPSGGSVISSATANGFGNSGNEGYYMAAYWGAEQTWDMFKSVFGRSSYNGSGGKVNIFVNGSGQGADNNAFWVGSWTYFGNASSGAPFTPLDVVGHEIAHGVTQTSAGLVYRNESGAMNEGFSDIFGCYAEYYAFNRLDSNVWTLGENISFQRSLSNPKQHRQPDTYNGTNWYTGSGDNGGVHINSGVLNHWFYILSQGKQGSNDKGSSYNVKGIGIEKAAQVAYRALTRYLTSSSNYSSARNAVINAATDLYGANSCELVATTDAMYAVGIGSKYSGSGCSTSDCSVIENVIASNVSVASATINWTAKSGVSNYQLEYKKSTDTNYTQTTVNGASQTLTGLSSNTLYQVRVTYTCDGKLATYSSVISFRTKNIIDPPKCDPVTGLNISNVSKNSVVLSWNSVPSINSYTVGYRKETSNSYTITSANGSSISINGLLPNTTYLARIKYSCNDGGGDTGCDGVSAYQSYPSIYMTGDKVTYNGKKYESLADNLYNIPPTGNTHSYLWKDLGPCSSSFSALENDSPYSSEIRFTTLQDDTNVCEAINNIDISSITTNSADVSWSPVLGITSFELEYKKSSDSSYNLVNVSSSSYSFTNLSASTSYQLRVRYTCSNGDKSPYSNTVSFVTEGTTGGCNGIPEYRNGVFYQKGDKVVYNGNVFEAQITVWWAPIYGYWTNLGPCNNLTVKQSFNIITNPAKEGVVIVSFNNLKGTNIHVNISDFSGNILVKRILTKLKLNSFNSQHEIAIPNLKTGVYFINVNGMTKKLIVE
ncbi:Por secretion system C-terminal sorting domain-containing protein [Tenacibaculum sp. MAR_2010_89]|uniref:M4 family metallopeptidase n=1 Tax=Tenacibaculum sp. MAR_2010_89 TaxID=1250198 RepID=UPI00089AB811|nr:M4 family metallopeptidase [Tenacibaculum sp. MAR_2010_89]SEE01491.1 Por secretion system C-terminal sorting domain-containing protein [Tenacibaculum sp. MAR_2010_89]